MWSRTGHLHLKQDLVVLKSSERRKKVKGLEHFFLNNATNQVAVMGIHNNTDYKGK